MTHPRDEIGSYDDIAAAAVRTTGLDDFGGTAHEEGLRLLVDDLASPEAGLTPLGNGFHRREVKSALVGRLLTQAAVHRASRSTRTSGSSARSSWSGCRAPAPPRCTGCCTPTRGTRGWSCG